MGGYRGARYVDRVEHHKALFLAHPRMALADGEGVVMALVGVVGERNGGAWGLILAVFGLAVAYAGVVLETGHKSHGRRAAGAALGGVGVSALCFGILMLVYWLTDKG